MNKLITVKTIKFDNGRTIPKNCIAYDMDWKDSFIVIHPDEVTEAPYTLIKVSKEVQASAFEQFVCPEKDKMKYAVLDSLIRHVKDRVLERQGGFFSKPDKKYVPYSDVTVAESSQKSFSDSDIELDDIFSEVDSMVDKSSKLEDAPKKKPTKKAKSKESTKESSALSLPGESAAELILRVDSKVFLEWLCAGENLFVTPDMMRRSDGRDMDEEDMESLKEGFWDSVPRERRRELSQSFGSSELNTQSIMLKNITMRHGKLSGIIFPTHPSIPVVISLEGFFEFLKEENLCFDTRAPLKEVYNKPQDTYLNIKPSLFVKKKSKTVTTFTASEKAVIEFYSKNKRYPNLEELGQIKSTLTVSQ